MITSGPAGFRKAPIMLFLFGFTLLLSVTNFFLLKFKDKETYLDLNWTALTQRYQLWRIVTSQFAFSHAMDFILGLALLYGFRYFERQMGSTKFAFAALWLLLFSTCLELLIELIFKIRSLPSGPYSIVFGLFVFFFLDVPKTRKFRVFFIPLSDKSFVYILGIQMLLIYPPVSVYVSLVGFLAGAIYKLLPFLQRVRAPQSVVRVCENCFSQFTERTPTNAYHRINSQSPPSHLDGSGEDVLVGGHIGYAPPAGNASVFPGAAMASMGSSSASNRNQGAVSASAMLAAEPDPQAVEELVSMGFSEAQVRQALSSCGNNVHLATERLLDGGH